MGNGNIWDILVGLAMIVAFAVAVGWYASKHRMSGTGGGPGDHRSTATGHEE